MKVINIMGSLVATVLLLISGVSYAQSSAEKSYYKGIEYGVRGDFKEAKKYFEKTLKIDPSFKTAEDSLIIINDVIEEKIIKETAIHLFKGFSSRGKGQYDQAISNYIKATEINPTYAGAFYYQGAAYNKKGQYDQAISDYTKAIMINSKYANAYYNRGVAYIRKGQYERAISDFTETIKINPKDEGAYNNRGIVYLTIDDKIKGCADSKKACGLGDCRTYNLAKEKGYCR